MGALAVVALKVQGQLQTVLIWIGLNLAFTFTVSGISWQGHIGGLVGGAVIGAAMVFAPRSHRSLVQWSVTGLVLVVSVVADRGAHRRAQRRPELGLTRRVGRPVTSSESVGSRARFV